MSTTSTHRSGRCKYWDTFRSALGDKSGKLTRLSGKSKPRPTQVGFRAGRSPPGPGSEPPHPGCRQAGDVPGQSCDRAWDHPPAKQKQEGVFCDSGAASPAQPAPVLSRTMVMSNSFSCILRALLYFPNFLQWMCMK